MSMPKRYTKEEMKPEALKLLKNMRACKEVDLDLYQIGTATNGIEINGDSVTAMGEAIGVVDWLLTLYE